MALSMDLRQRRIGLNVSVVLSVRGTLSRFINRKEEHVVPKYVVPLIVSYYEYMLVEAESPEEAIHKVKDGEGSELGKPEFREVMDVGPEEFVEEEEVEVE
jgi:hypothetical protein